MTSEELSNYGNVQLLKLLNHFGQERSNERGVIFPAVVNPTHTDQGGMVFAEGHC